MQQTLGHIGGRRVDEPAEVDGSLRGLTGFRFDALIGKDIAAQTAGGPAETLARFRSIESSNGHPPGPVDSWLGETFVHAEDIRRPLGITHDYYVDAAYRLADFYTRPTC